MLGAHFASYDSHIEKHGNFYAMCEVPLVLNRPQCLLAFNLLE